MTAPTDPEESPLGTFDDPYGPLRKLPATSIVHRTRIGDVVEEIEVKFDGTGVLGMDLEQIASALHLSPYPKRWVAGIDPGTYCSAHREVHP